MPDNSGRRISGRGALESEWLNADQTVRLRSLVTHEIAADRAASLPVPTVR